MKNTFISRWFFIPALFFITSIATVYAEVPCGDIVDNEGVRKAVADCSNPFSIIDSGYPFTVKISNQTLADGIVISIPIDEAITYSFPLPPGFVGINHTFYTHEGNDYRQVFPVSYTSSQITTFASEYFSSEIDSYLYIQRAVIDFVDASLVNEDLFDDVDDDFWNTYYDFSDYIYSRPEPLPLAPGTYTLVSEAIRIFLWQETTILQKFFAWVIPTAYAQFAPNPRHAMTFTVVYEDSEPAGASSILFLPGIMGSHLYEDGDVCGQSGEVQLWTSIWPFKNTCKQLRLKTNVEGESINDIYTKPEAIVEEVLGFNLYQSFVADLATWQQEGSIGGYKVVPYDWRLKLDDILKTKLVDGRVVFDADAHYTESYLYQSLAALATTTTSEVTIVAHSNGGLLAKYFLDYLEEQNDPLLPQIKNLILVAVPQSGTPEAVISMLHGSGMGPFDTVVAQQTARELVTTSAFGHHLLPSSSYFNSTDIPVIAFSPGAATNSFVEKYGTSISNKDDLHAFLSDPSRQVPAADEVGIPSVVDQFLLSYSDGVHSAQSQWQLPETLKVHQVAGTGLYTPITIEYFTNEKCIKRNPLKLFMCVETASSLSYRVILTRVGDETVVDWSAVDNGSTVQKSYLDLQRFNEEVLFDRIHRDILEVPELRTFIKNTISDIDPSYTYISSNRPAFSEDKKIKTYLHSPLDLTAVHVDGTVVSSTTPRYQGVEYFRFGEVQTIIVPDELRDLVTLKLDGESFGSFTLEIEEWEGNSQLSSKKFKAIPSDIGTVVTVPLTESLDETMLIVDYDGNTDIDVMVELNEVGELIYNEMVEDSSPQVASPTVLRSSGSIIRPTPEIQVLGVANTNASELEYLKQVSDLLVELVRLLMLLEELKK